jgi:hypothetical protein
VELGKDTKINISLGLVAGLAFYLVSATLFLQEKVTLIDDALASSYVNNISQVEHDLEHARKFRLELRAYLRANPNDEAAQKDLDEVEDIIEDLNTELECLHDGDCE